MGYILEFKDQPSANVFELAPETAIAFFQAKGLKPTFSYLDMVREEHDVAFTVAKMMQVDLLDTTSKTIDKALQEGWSMGRFRKELAPALKSAGWWGQADLFSPAGNLVQGAQLGSAHRLNTIFRSNLQSAYSVGRWERIQEDAELAPWLIYDAVDDYRTREAHAKLDNTVLPVSDPFWRAFMPPNGYNCRCGVIQASDRDLERLGMTPSKRPKVKMVKWTNPRTGKVEEIPAAIDPGWDHNPGLDRLEHLQALAAQKINRLPPEWAAKAKKAQADYKLQQSVISAQKALAAEQGAEQLARSKAKVQERAAQWQIDNALEEKTPYLAAAIKKVQAAKSNEGLTAQQVLAKANEVAETQKKNHALSKYKNAIATGKEPGDDLVAVFNSLPSNEQAKINKQIAEIQAKKAAEQALAEIEGASGVYAQALKKLQDSGEADELSVVDLLKTVLAQGDAQKAKISQGLKLSNYKKAVIAGKTPTPEGKAAFDGLDETAQAKILEEIQEAQAAKAPDPKPAESVPAETGINVDALTQIGPQRGSNPGGLFQDTETGIKWYIKTPGSADNARNEVLAAKLYQSAGLEVPELQLIDWKGQPSIASKIVDGLESVTPERLARAKGTGEGFVVDAWLANWDVVGLSYDNLLLRGSQAVRVDTGGALRYRAQGSQKGAAWGSSVDEIDSLRNPGTNRQAATVFGNVSRDDLVAGARRVLAVSESEIRDLVRKYGPEDLATAEQLVATLRARQDDIARRFPEATAETRAEPPIDFGQRVSASDQRTIRDSRLNGYAMPTDKDQIEDQEVLVWNERSRSQGDVTRASLKVRASGMEALERLLSGGASDEVNVLGQVDATILEAVKGIAKFHKDEGLRAKDVQRAQAALDQWDKVVDRMTRELRAGTIDAEDLKRINAAYRPWIESLRIVTQTEVGTKDYWLPPADVFKGAGNPKRKGAERPGLKLEQRKGAPFARKDIRQGRAEETDQPINAPTTTYYEGTLEDGTVVRYWSSTNEYFALRGRVEIQTPGSNEAASARIFSALDELGVNSELPSAGDAEELYLRQIAYHRREGWRSIEKQLDSTDNQEERIQILRQNLELQIGKDPTELPGYNPSGQYEAFGHGHRHRYRPDLVGPEWDRFRSDYRLHHNITGGNTLVSALTSILNAGGKMAPSVDKLRRGIPLGGMSPVPDLQSGGASYFFTRIKTRQNAQRQQGIVWKADLIGRLDAISYDSDNFGRVTGDHVLQNRKTGVDEWRAASRNGSNETIFKNSLSLFDFLDRIVTGSASERQAVIQVFRDNGYQQFPDGRDLEEVIK